MGRLVIGLVVQFPVFFVTVTLFRCLVATLISIIDVYCHIRFNKALELGTQKRV